MWNRGAVIYCATCHRESEVTIMTFMAWRKPHITHCPLCGSKIDGTALIPKEEIIPEEYEKAEKK